MLSRNHRLAFTQKELLIVLGAICVLIALLLPAIQTARENQRLNTCSNNLKLIGLALQNYADKRKLYLPPISTNQDPVPDIPGDSTATTDNAHAASGSAPSPGAGYSWMVLILPDLECGIPYEGISKSSNKFTSPAFSSAIYSSSNGKPSFHAATLINSYPIAPVFQCPSFSGKRTLDTTPRTIGINGGAIETGTIPPNYTGGIATANGAAGIAITNYNAVLGTHIDVMTDGVYPARSASSKNSNNGGMKFRGDAYDKGFSLYKFFDGTSYVFLVTETRERRFASWYDGTMNWVVATRHSNPTNGTTAITPAHKAETGNNTGRWVVGTDGTSATGGTALNYGPTPHYPTAVYLPTDALADPDISGIVPGRLWGPSSEHRGGLVNHVFADGHVAKIADNIDPNTYLWYVTRGDGDLPVPD